MFLVKFRLYNPNDKTLTPTEINQAMIQARTGSDYEDRCQQLIKDGVILHRGSAVENTEATGNIVVYNSWWVSQAANQSWTDSIYATPSTKLFYDNLHSAGFEFTVEKLDVTTNTIVSGNTVST